jgi:hypothetical protein
MESHGEVNKIHCSETTAALLLSTGIFNISKRGVIEVKGKGKMTTYWIEKSSDCNPYSNQTAAAKAMESSIAILESSVFQGNEDTETDEPIDLPILAMMPKDAFKSTKSSFSSFRLSFSGKKREEPSTPIPLPPISPPSSPIVSTR